MPAYTDEILRALADPERLAIAGFLARRSPTGGELGGRARPHPRPRRSATAEELAAELGLKLDRVHKHLVRLSAVRVVAVEDDRHTYRLQPEVLREAAEAVAPPRDPGRALGAVDDDEETVLRQYFREGRLREIPAKRSKRLV